MIRFLVALTMCLVASCGTTTEELPDINLVDLECRAPSACFTKSCDCARTSLEVCKVCDPLTATGNVCDCGSLGADIVCQNEVDLCVARGPSCSGRCVAFSGSCSTSLGVPPQTIAVSNDGGAGFETRCPYTDDQCCPGVSVDLL
jgi:hypothetical protein